MLSWRFRYSKIRGIEQRNRKMHNIASTHLKSALGYLKSSMDDLSERKALLHKIHNAIQDARNREAHLLSFVHAGNMEVALRALSPAIEDAKKLQALRRALSEMDAPLVEIEDAIPDLEDIQ